MIQDEWFRTDREIQEMIISDLVKRQKELVINFMWKELTKHLCDIRDFNYGDPGVEDVTYRLDDFINWEPKHGYRYINCPPISDFAYVNVIYKEE